MRRSGFSFRLASMTLMSASGPPAAARSVLPSPVLREILTGSMLEWTSFTWRISSVYAASGAAPSEIPETFSKPVTPSRLPVTEEQEESASAARAAGTPRISRLIRGFLRFLISYSPVRVN